MAKMSEVQETFSAPLDPAKWSTVRMLVANGRGVFNVTNSYPDTQAEILTPVTVDASNSTLSARLIPTVLEPGVQAVITQLELGVWGPYNAEQFGNERVSVQISNFGPNGESISLNRSNWSGPSPSYVTIPYNRTNHAYVRIRFNGTDVHLETSPDGKKWTDHGSIKHTLTTLNVTAGVKYFSGVGDLAYIDDINIIPSGGQFFQFFN